MEKDFLLEDEERESAELYEHFKIEVDKGQSMVRIDKFLTQRIENASRSKIQAAADAGNILANGKPVKSNYKIKPLDVLSIVMATPPREIELIPQDIPLNIVYEDDDVAVVNKAPGMVVHPAYGNYTGTLVNALAWHFRDLPLFKTGDMRPGLVHRIDKNTSGLIVIAKNENALMKLAKQFFDHSCDRCYQALVWGNFDEDEGTVNCNVGRSIKDRKIMGVFPDGSQGKTAITHYKVLERFGYVTLIECKLETGRTHQIRVHMKSIGHPLFNDPEYGGDYILKGTTFNKYKQFINNCFDILPRQALHAKTIAFNHPVTKERLSFNSELAPDMVEVLDKWRIYTSSRNAFED
jgi:23S rRNA pseudouridine1911/1915/1917 synthase